ncbi:AcsA protein [Salinicola corii]|uniref:AcsA protein n=1 Tax=Salinicola corii TaxID=2606937 RepID=A0A640WBS6_9GAMM|nr:IucA/IucC family protein [Salinicola corii]KAA0016967.1 AcsA protein [Salinicola corii]
MTDHERQAAERQILRTLVDALLAENLFGGVPTRWLTAEDAEMAAFPCVLRDGSKVSVHWRLWWCSLGQDSGDGLAFWVQPGITQTWCLVPGSWVWRLPVGLEGLPLPAGSAGGREPEALSPEGLMRWLFAATHPASTTPTAGESVFLEALETSVWQRARSQRHRIDPARTVTGSVLARFTALEQWASLRDRPYHPTAKAKQGLDATDYAAYVAEFDADIALCWVAIRRAQSMTGAGVADGESPADWLLDARARSALQDEMRARGLDETHVAIPMHPWQREHAVPRWLAEAFAAGACVDLETRSPGWKASSSLRSLLPTRESPHTLKLPMAVHSLGASRYLPAVKMINGDLSAALLAQARALDPRLGEALHLCDEGRWWAYLPQDATLFDEAPRHLSAMVRSYPTPLLEDARYQLVPMATLGTPLDAPRHHPFDDWLQQRGWKASADNVRRLLGEVCERFFELCLRLFRLGMLPEVHGQNAVMVLHEGRVQGLLLRDHDSLRIAVPRLEAHGMADPCYRIKPGHANTLYHDDLGELLFWLQTLAIQVNVRSIVDTIASHYDISEVTLWHEVADQLHRQIDDLPFSTADREMLNRRLFEASHWPFKHLIGPIIQRAGGPGSMPFSTGEAINPFQAIGWQRRRVGEATTADA